MSSLIILVGISGSGKSTWAAHKAKESNDYLVVNRDKIRELIFGYTESTISEYYSRKDLNAQEKEVTEYENVLIKEGLAKGKIVIVDATHLERKYIERFKFFNVYTRIIYFDTDLEVAIRRDSERVRVVGEDIIKKQYDKYQKLIKNKVNGWSEEKIYKYSPIKSDCVIFDIDGTLALNQGRNPFDWKRVGEDNLSAPVAVLYDALINESVKTIICTGRSLEAEADTKEWLHRWGIEWYEEFHIREEGDFRPDWQIKREMWEDIQERYNILFMVDDRNQVVDYARSLGFNVFQVSYNSF